MTIRKMFYEVYTGKYAATMAEAKRINRNDPYIKRVWLTDDNKIVDSISVYANGKRLCSINLADKVIAIKQKTRLK